MTRDRLFSFVLLPLLLVAVGVLAYFTFRTTLQIDKLRQQSVLEAALGLANEKAHRLDRQIIDQDNVLVAVVDPESLGELGERWLPTAARETPTVRAVLVLDENKTVLAFASRASGAYYDEEAFRRLLVQRITVDMQLAEVPNDELRHLHREYASQSYLVSYWYRARAGRRYLVVAWHDVGRIVKETLPTLYSERPTPGETAAPQSRVNVVDEDGRIIFGPPLRSGQFTVGVRFPTTLYNWRLQVAPTASEELSSSVQNRRMLELVMVGLSCLVVVAGVAAILVAAERERRMSAIKSDFVANVSHELKTPLALVRMFGEMLQSGRVTTAEKQREYLEIIVRESERLTALIENVLDFAKVERGRKAYELSEGDVSRAVTDAIQVYRYRAEREGVEIDLDAPTDLPPARLDDRAVGLAVINLVDNALKYAKGTKTVSVRVQMRGRDIAIAVTDQGPGVPAEERQRIFDRFVRGESTRRESRVRGSGIGLALVKHVAESHGGRAWVEAAPGGGARFLFTIPTLRGREAAQRLPPSPPARNAARVGGPDAAPSAHPPDAARLGGPDAAPSGPDGSASEPARREGGASPPPAEAD
ncbi:MAG: sensor histidine kinase [Myxococcales bacterium]|nr:sensor histidine kinase [Myxococcales bacterium]